MWPGECMDLQIVCVCTLIRVNVFILACMSVSACVGARVPGSECCIPDVPSHHTSLPFLFSLSLPTSLHFPPSSSSAIREKEMKRDKDNKKTKNKENTGL